MWFIFPSRILPFPFRDFVPSRFRDPLANGFSSSYGQIGKLFLTGSLPVLRVVTPVYGLPIGRA